MAEESPLAERHTGSFVINPTNPNNPKDSSTPRVNGELDKIVKDVRILYSKEVNPVRNSSRCDSKPNGALFLTG